MSESRISVLKYTDPQLKKVHIIKRDKHKEGQCLTTALWDVCYSHFAEEGEKGAESYLSKVILAGLIQVMNRVVEVPSCLSSHEIVNEEDSGGGFYGVTERAEYSPMMRCECSGYSSFAYNRNHFLWFN